MASAAASPVGRDVIVVAGGGAKGGEEVRPTASLEAALGEFREVLTEADRRRLGQVRGRPGAMSDAAMQFTASLDRENAARRGPSVASRLYALLSSVQRFVGVVDTFVSSDPAVAALVWGAVKLTMLVGVHIPILAALSCCRLPSPPSVFSFLAMTPRGHELWACMHACAACGNELGC